MIGYPVSRAELCELIEAEVPGWLKRAQERTAGFRKFGRYRESSSIWNEVKPVYMRLQGRSKCAFCERKLESVDFGKGEQAVEHFRPKRTIKSWNLPTWLANMGVMVAPSPAGGGGYYLLAYDVFNYSAACNPCNSALKRDYFPVGRAHKLNGTRPEKLSGELPLLLYPIGDFDENPEDVIRFHGISPQPVPASGPGRDRALVTIEFFQLDSPKRKNLLRERALVLVALHPALEMLAARSRQAARFTAQKVVEGFTAPHAPHANCARSFRSLHARDAAEAQAIFDRAARFLASIS
jgi:hypothetical protein